MERYALITGSSGAIGSAVVDKFKAEGFFVCGIDIVLRKDQVIDYFIQADLNEFVTDEFCRGNVFIEINKWLDGNSLDVLVNNAAFQYISLNHPIPVFELSKSFNINVISPYLLITNLANLFSKKTGSVVNIGSIHSRLSKPGFVAYAATKAAIAALTKGLALDYEDKMRINCVEPAAVETPMLLDGFKEFPERKIELESFHPQKRISTPEEISELVFLICSDRLQFLHGSCIDISGGISGRLHDPT